MDLKHAAELKPGARVAVPMGAFPSEVFGTPPIVTTGTVLEPVHGDIYVWIAVDIAVDETLPQQYRVEEILGFLMPMAVVERSADGQTLTGRFPEGYVGP